jgi:branched-chain amino acid transport system substrate-binding protein
MIQSDPIEPKRVTLTIKSKSTESLSISLSIRSANTNLLIDRIEDRLLPLPHQELLDAYTTWQNSYLAWGGRNRFWQRSINAMNEEPIETNVAISTEANASIRNAVDLKNRLIKEFNIWLSMSVSPDLFAIRESLIDHITTQQYRGRSELLSIIIQTITEDEELDLILQKLPWNEWQFVHERYGDDQGIALSTRDAPNVAQPTNALKALVIIGSYNEPENGGIDLKPDLNALRQTLGEIVELEVWPSLENPESNTRLNLLQKLEQETYHLIFFCGHSLDHEIYLNDNEYISMNDIQFTNALTGLKRRGLLLLFFNSCSGLKIARTGMSVGVPYVVVMKELVHDLVAQEFIKYFLKEATKPGIPIHIAFNEARRKLRWLTGLPHGEFLPVLFQNPEQQAFYINPYSRIPEVTRGETAVNPKPGKWQKAIERIKRFAKSSNGKFFAFITLFAISAFVLTQIFIKPDLAIVPDRIRANMDISLGDKELIKYNEPKLQKGFNDFRDGNYKPAIRAFDEYLLKNKYSPEITIAKSNAKAALIAIENNQTPIRISAGVPLLSNIPVAKEILAGMAMYQEKAIQANVSLQIAIGRDSNIKESAEAIASKLVLEPSISGVIGHNASAASIAAAKIYNTNGLVMISPTSFDNKKLPTINYAYKMVSQMEYFASELKKYIGNSLKGNHRIAICLDAKSTDNEIFTKLFLDKLDFDKFQRLDCGNFESIDKKTIDRMIKEVKTGGGNYKTIGLLISPHIDAIPQAMSILTAVKKEIGSDFQLFGAPSLYTHDTAEKATAETTGLIIPVPYFPSSGNEFVNQYKSQWGEDLNNWRTPMAYASTKVMIESILKIGNINSLYRRKTLNGYLQNTKEFSADNVIEKFTFGSENHTLQYVNPSSSLGALIKLKKNGEFELIKRFAGTRNK